MYSFGKLTRSCAGSYITETSVNDYPAYFWRSSFSLCLKYVLCNLPIMMYLASQKCVWNCAWCEKFHLEFIMYLFGVPWAEFTMRIVQRRCKLWDLWSVYACEIGWCWADVLWNLLSYFSYWHMFCIVQSPYVDTAMPEAQELLFLQLTFPPCFNQWIG